MSYTSDRVLTVLLKTGQGVLQHGLCGSRTLRPGSLPLATSSRRASGYRSQSFSTFWLQDGFIWKQVRLKFGFIVYMGVSRHWITFLEAILCSQRLIYPSHVTKAYHSVMAGSRPCLPSRCWAWIFRAPDQVNSDVCGFGPLKVSFNPITTGCRLTSGLHDYL